MTRIGRRARSFTLPLALGFTDGVLNALVLASTALLDGSGISAELGLRVGCVALVTAAFTVYVAEYAELRSRLSRSTKKLNLTTRGHLAATRLGRQVQVEGSQSAAVACVSSFVGAVVPLLVAGAVPAASWIGLPVALALLAVLGAVLAGTVEGQRWRWSAGLVVAGAAVAAIGSQLNIT